MIKNINNFKKFLVVVSLGFFNLTINGMHYTESPKHKHETKGSKFITRRKQEDISCKNGEAPIDAVRRILGSCNDIADLQLYRAHRKLNLLSWAIFNNCQEGAQEVIAFLQTNSDAFDTFLDQPDEYGQTALFLASFKGYENLVKFLVESGADINTQVGIRTVLDVAKSDSIKSYLISNGAKTQQQLLDDLLALCDDNLSSDLSSEDRESYESSEENDVTDLIYSFEYVNDDDSEVDEIVKQIPAKPVALQIEPEGSYLKGFLIGFGGIALSSVAAYLIKTRLLNSQHEDSSKK